MQDKITNEKLELAFEYRGLEKLYRDFFDPYIRIQYIRLINDDVMDMRLGVPLECRKNVILRMKMIRAKLKNIDGIFHI